MKQPRPDILNVIHPLMQIFFHLYQFVMFTSNTLQKSLHVVSIITTQIFSMAKKTGIIHLI